MKNSALLKYLSPILALAAFAFLMVAYSSAYTPAKPSKQRIVCYKFKEGISQKAIQSHLDDFQNLKREIREIVAYSAGSTVADEEEIRSEYELVHHLTFRTEEDIEKFKLNPIYLDFLSKHKADWEKVMVINAEIK